VRDCNTDVGSESCDVVAIDFCRELRHTDARMSFMKNNSFTDRAAASAEAKKALLAKLKVKPTVTAPVGPTRAELKEAKLAELRAQREAERAEKRRIAEEAEARRREIEAFDAETAELELRAKQKAARDARYAARKQRR
jgi:hypothetical protein